MLITRKTQKPWKKCFGKVMGNLRKSSNYVQNKHILHGVNSFSTYAKFSGKLTFFTP